MQVVLLVNLLLHAPINAKLHDERVVLASRATILMVRMLQCLLQLLDLASSRVLLFLNRVLEIATETLNLLNLLTKVAP